MIYLLTVPRRCFFCGSIVSLMSSHLFISALWTSAGKGLTSLLLFVMSYCDFDTLQCGILCQVWYLIVLIPDLWRLSYFDTEVIVETNVVVFLLKTIVSFNSGNVKMENLYNYYKTIKPISGSFLNA